MSSQPFAETSVSSGRPTGRGGSTQPLIRRGAGGLLRRVRRRRYLGAGEARAATRGRFSVIPRSTSHSAAPASSDYIQGPRAPYPGRVSSIRESFSAALPGKLRVPPHDTDQAPPVSAAGTVQRNESSARTTTTGYGRWRQTPASSTTRPCSSGYRHPRRTSLERPVRCTGRSTCAHAGTPG